MSSQPSPTSLPAVPIKPAGPGAAPPSPSTQTPSVDAAQISAPPKTRSISFAGPSKSVAPRFDRRTSIQFAPSSDSPDRPARIKIAELETKVPEKGPRLPSPPPPSTYHSRVSFDTFNNSSVTDQEFTLVCKHNGYAYGRHQRVFLVAIDQNAYSEHALKWLIEDMVEDGDEVICLRVVETDPKAKEGATSAQMITYKEDAKVLLKQIQEKNDAADKKAISIVMEFAVGNVEQTILHMINIYSPAFLTVGTRGKSLGGLQGLLPGSVSKWCMQNSPVPVVVVRHPDKRQKKMNKRKNDPNRRGYATILDKSASIPGSEHATLKDGKIIEAEGGEAEAVAKALGLSSNLASWKGFGAKKGDGEANTASESSLAPSTRGGMGKQRTKKDDSRDGEGNEEEGVEEAGDDDNENDGDEEDEDDDDDDDEEDDDEEEEEEDDDQNSGGESPTGVIYAESGGMETMPNYAGEPADPDDLNDDVERLALSDEEDRKPANGAEGSSEITQMRLLSRE